MTEDDLYNNVVKSLIRWIEDFRKAEAPEAVYVDWDEHAQISDLPDARVIVGPAGCGLAEESPNEYMVVFSFGVATYQDRNLIRLRSLISKIFGRLRIGARLPVYDSATGAEAGWMVIKSPRAITPVSRAEIRSLQFVELTALLDPGATSSLR